MKFEIHSDQAVLTMLKTARETNAQLWLYFPDSQTGECYPVIIPSKQTVDESNWEALAIKSIKLNVSLEKRIAELERTEKKFGELCQMAGGEDKLLGLLMSTKLGANDDTNTNQSATGESYRSEFLTRRGQ